MLRITIRGVFLCIFIHTLIQLSEVEGRGGGRGGGRGRSGYGRRGGGGGGGGSSTVWIILGVIFGVCLTVGCCVYCCYDSHEYDSDVIKDVNDVNAAEPADSDHAESDPTAVMMETTPRDRALDMHLGQNLSSNQFS